jgi:hypothetical protein
MHGTTAVPTMLLHMNTLHLRCLARLLLYTQQIIIDDNLPVI